jgi:methyl-accepting chemotaxis protein
MKWFYDLKIAHKLNVAFAIVLLFIAALGVFSVSQLASVNQSSTVMATNWLPSIRALSKMALTMSRTRSFDLQHLLTKDAKDLEYVETRATEQLAKLSEQTTQYGTFVSEPREKELYPEIQKSVAAFVALHERMVALSREGKKEEAEKLMKEESTPIYRKTISQIEELIDMNNNGANESNTAADRTYVDSRLAIGSAVALCILCGFILSWWLARQVSRPLNKALAVARQVAEGDLSAEIESSGKDETGQLLDALKTMNQNLQKIVCEVRLGTDTITTASSEIASGNMDLSSRTEQQAGALEETASAMEEMTSTVRQNADNARQANQLAVSASAIAQAGGNVVGQVVETMGAINDSSRKIVEIISVIDSIAFQTNILALNAAVEAARAGEQGRGFAVVAAEVRTLAQRSAAAAHEIKALIDDSVSKVDSGSKLVNEAGATMSQVVSSVKQVSDIVAEITAASEEQRQGIDQINTAITHMDETTQQNAALVEEAAAAANSLQDQATQLSRTVSIFKLDSVVVAPAPLVQKMARNATPARTTVKAPAAPRFKTSVPVLATTADTNWEQF